MTTTLPTAPLSIGNVSIGFPVVQAALSGYSDLPMRVIARRHGADYAICEVMLDQFLLALSKRQKTKHFLDIHAEEHPVGGQLMGAEPEQFSAGAMKLVEAGFDIIDVNFGCPVKKVLGRCRGGFHLSQPEVAIEILKRTRDIVPDEIPVTVKMRRGIDDTSESRDNFFRILDGAIDAGFGSSHRAWPHRSTAIRRTESLGVSLAGQTARGRRAQDSWAAAICSLRPRLLEHAAANRMSTVSRSPVVRSATLGFSGRPRVLAAGDPLPPPPSLHEQAAVMREHFALCEQTYTPARAPVVMRKFCIKYCQSHPDHDRCDSRLVKMRSRRGL